MLQLPIQLTTAILYVCSTVGGAHGLDIAPPVAPPAVSELGHDPRRGEDILPVVRGAWGLTGLMGCHLETWHRVGRCGVTVGQQCTARARAAAGQS
eukprot:COSAG01_NODE_197_length_22333_cov_45.774759_11_plen_96_part_00